MGHFYPFESAARGEIDAQVAAELIALGYVAHAPRMEMDAGESPLDLYGPDPNELVAGAEAVARAHGYLRRERPKEALKLLEPVRTQAPESTQVLLLTARAQTQAGLESEALQTFETLLGLEEIQQCGQLQASCIVEQLYGRAASYADEVCRARRQACASG